MSADLNFPKEQWGTSLAEGGVYEYIIDYPKGCKGGLYRIEGFIKDVPSYQDKVLVRCVQGKDAGMRFVVSEQNFAIRYKRVG